MILSDFESFRLTAPPDNEEVLSWWGNSFETVFCMLHPFFFVEPQNKWIFQNENGVTRDQLSRLFTAVTWKNIVKMADLSGIGELNKLLLQSVGSVSKNNPEINEHFDRVLLDKNIRQPEEGAMSELLLDDILSSFKLFDSTHVYVADEFGLRITKYEIDELLSREHFIIGEAHPSIISEDLALLYCVHWDSFSTFLCGSFNIVSEILAKYDFEGFFADEETRVYWNT
jgi:hypothetical protein